MKHRTTVLGSALLIIALTGSFILATTTFDTQSSQRSVLPLPGEAKSLLNSTHRHGDWVRIPVGSRTILAAVDYPDRSDKAAVVVITAKDQKLTDWLRAVADQVASEGFITVVPDTLSSATGDV